ncbi:MAG: hypothetical protein WC380_00135 [Pedobacter sp.]|jgi:hypothetical protein
MSKELFFNMRAEEMATMYDHSFTKKDAETTGLNLVKQIFENGEVEPIKVMSNIVRLKAVIDSAEKSFRERLSLQNADSWNGVTFTPKNGSEKLNLSEDPVYAELEAKLKERGELVKLATKSKDTIFDSDGCEVPKVSSTFNKASITITF